MNGLHLLVSFQFDWLSIVLLAIFIGFPLIRGLIKGTSFMFFRFIAGTLILVAAFFLAKPVAGWLSTTPIAGFVQNPIYDFLVSKSEYAAQPSPGKEALAAFLSQNNYEAVTAMGVPAPFAPNVTDYVVGVVPEAASDIAIGTYVAQAITALSLSIASFVVIWLILTIIKTIIAKIFDRRREERGVKFLSRLGGMIIGIAIGAVNLLSIFYAVSMLTGIPVIYNFLNAAWFLEDPEVLTIGKWLYESNFFQHIAKYFFL